VAISVAHQPMSLRGTECRGNLGGAVARGLASVLSSPAPSPPRLLRYARKDSVGFPRLLRRFALLAMRDEVPLAMTKM